jgi:hypothetical protein
MCAVDISTLEYENPTIYESFEIAPSSSVFETNLGI